MIKHHSVSLYQVGADVRMSELKAVISNHSIDYMYVPEGALV